MISSPYIHNAPYIESLFEAYQRDPQSIPSEWGDLFSKVSVGRDINWESFDQLSTRPFSESQNISSTSTSQAVHDSIRALMMIRNYRVRGHLHADLDPLKIEKRHPHTELSPSFYGFEEADYNRLIYLDGVLGFQIATLHQVLERLHKTYCGTIGVEFMHIQDPDKKNWIQEFFESIPFTLAPPQKKALLNDLIRAELFEKFLHTKFQGAKRFGLDGGESLIPAMESILHSITQQGVEHLVMGMAHRGRLNILTNIIGKPFRNLFSKFLAAKENPYAIGSGDVKYHLGYSNDRVIDNKKLHLSLVSNPSHLEAINPVVLGKVRSEQYHFNDTKRKKVMGLLMHGDAAFAGQGLVAETLELSDLPGYRTGGTLHIIINNQIGFTTSPPHSRSSPYSSDIAKAIQAPIFHVNSDDPEAVLRVCKAAVDYREHFGQDVVIDLICYRRYGHNESDEPSFTQPLMYKAIHQHPSTATLYGEKLQKDGVISAEEMSNLSADFQERLDADYQKAVAGEDCFDHPHWLKGAWQGIESSASDDHAPEVQPPTGVSPEVIKSLGQNIFKIPENFALNSKIARQLQAKQKMIETGEGFDWGTAEALAFATLLDEEYLVRLSGQDCGRGTFSHRHAVLVDQETEKKYIPLSHLHKGYFEVIDSPLAEASVLGFEYGYSSANPHQLVIWEAQFGDFANGAQVIIDQFLSAGEMKWARQNGLVLLLPHGFEGQGPEHSSARLERFLQLCGEGNWSVANCSTPANYFHILRRQLKQTYRKPLVLMTPKSLLRHKLCVSSLSDFEGTFKPVISDTKNPEMIEKVILCSGKIYFDFLEESLKNNHAHTAIIRLEQFYPWPKHDLIKALTPYKHAEIIWCQEEPENMGAWHFVDRRLEAILHHIQAHTPRPFVIARPVAASTATGLLSRHEKEQRLIIEKAFAPTHVKPLSAIK